AAFCESGCWSAASWYLMNITRVRFVVVTESPWFAHGSIGRGTAGTRRRTRPHRKGSWRARCHAGPRLVERGPEARSGGKMRTVPFPLMAATLTGLVACGGGEKPADTDATAGASGPRDTLVVAWPSDIGTLIGPVVASATDAYIVDNITVPIIDNDFDC